MKEGEILYITRSEDLQVMETWEAMRDFSLGDFALWYLEISVGGMKRDLEDLLNILERGGYIKKTKVKRQTGVICLIERFKPLG